MLILFGGLPGTGKSSIARELAKQIGAVHLRIDSIEHVLMTSPSLVGEVNDVGYRIAYAVAADNLRLGRVVLADSVNPIAITRDAWHRVGEEAGVAMHDVEVIRSNKDEHRRRVESRASDIPGFELPTWVQVESRHYTPRTDERIIVDTASSSIEESVAKIRERLGR